MIHLLVYFNSAVRAAIGGANIIFYIAAMNSVKSLLHRAESLFLIEAFLRQGN